MIQMLELTDRPKRITMTMLNKIQRNMAEG